MRFFTRLCVCIVAAIGVLIGLSLFTAFRSDDRSQYLPLGRWLVFESRRSEALRHRAESIAHGNEVKKAIIADLLGGRLTLRQAAAQFREANQLIENNVPDLVADYRTPTREEGLCRQVLAWVRTEIESFPPEKAKSLLEPLEKEFESIFGHPEAILISPLEMEP